MIFGVKATHNFSYLKEFGDAILSNSRSNDLDDVFHRFMLRSF